MTDSLVAGKDSEQVLGYFARNGAPCPEDTNPADHIVEVLQGNSDVKIDWIEIWSRSTERQQALGKLMALNQQGLA